MSGLDQDFSRRDTGIKYFIITSVSASRSQTHKLNNSSLACMWLPVSDFYAIRYRNLIRRSSLVTSLPNLIF